MDLELEQIERQFDRAAATYDSVAIVQRQMADQLLSRMPMKLAGTLVDLGCGTGDLLEKLSRRIIAANLTGVDISSAMLERTRLRIPESRLVKADLAQLPIEDDSFQCAVSNAAIQWCDSKAVFSELRRVLKPGGQAFLSTFGPSTLWQWRKALDAVSGKHDRVHTFKTREELCDELGAEGFSSVETHVEEIDIHFDSVSQMFDSIRKLGATNARRDRQSGLSGRDWYRRVHDTFEDQRNSNGKLSLTYECFYLTIS